MTDRPPEHGAALRRSIRAEMARQGVSMTDMSSHIGMTRQSLWKILSGVQELTDWRLNQIASVLDMSVEQLKGDDGTKTGTTPLS